MLTSSPVILIKNKNWFSNFFMLYRCNMVYKIITPVLFRVKNDIKHAKTHIIISIWNADNITVLTQFAFDSY